MEPAPSLLDLTDFQPGALPAAIRVPRVERAFSATVRPPGSKSLTNRALLLAALARGRSRLRGALVDADDAQVMVAALRRLGARVESHRRDAGATETHPRDAGATGGDEELMVDGVGGRWATGSAAVTLDLHNAGTATRFLAAAALLADPGAGGIVIDGDARMRERPIGELTAALVALGARVEHLGREGCPPVRVRPPAHEPDATPTVDFGRTASSQFISALLLAGAFLPRGLRVAVRGELTSPDYVWMTLALLERVGVPVRRRSTAGLSLDVEVPRHELAGFELEIEPDASGATYFQAAAALIPGAAVTIEGLPADPTASLQGDARFVEALAAMGASIAGDRTRHTVVGPAILRAIDIDLSRMPDTAQTLAALACFAGAAAGEGEAAATSVLRGLRTLRVKETDRLAALQTELTKADAAVEIEAVRGDELIRVRPPGDFVGSPVCAGVWEHRRDAGATGGAGHRRDAGATGLGSRALVFDTYHDHRMAMALALVGLRSPRPVVIRDPACVRKTYPGFWADLRRLYA